MTRRKPLKRHTRLKAKRPRRLDRPGADPGHLAFVRTLPCIVASPDCVGNIEASHVTVRLGLRGVGIKVPDEYAVPHCSIHHRQWEERRGIFRGWTKAERMNVASQWVALVRSMAGPDTRERAA